MDSVEAYEAACHLYDGGWRAEDANWIRTEYGLSDYETLLIYYALLDIGRNKEAEEEGRYKSMEG